MAIDLLKIDMFCQEKLWKFLWVHQNHHRTRGFNNGCWAKVRSLKPSKTLAQLRLGFCHSKMSDLRGGGSLEGWMAPEKISSLDPCTDHNCHNFLQQKETHGHGMSWSKSEFHEFLLKICYDKIMNPLRDTVLKQGHHKSLTLLGGRGNPRNATAMFSASTSTGASALSSTVSEDQTKPQKFIAEKACSSVQVNSAYSWAWKAGIWWWVGWV